MPVRVVWAYFAALAMDRAVTALDTARGIGLAFAGDDAGRRLLEGAVDDAFPDARPAAERAATDREGSAP